MKFSTAFIAAAVAGLAAAQSQCLSTAEAIPSCGQACLATAASSQGCQATDFACQCSKSAQINNSALSSCVIAQCGGANQQALAVASGAQAVCSCVAANGKAATAPATTTAHIPSETVAIGSVTQMAAAATTSAAAAPPKQSAAKSTPVVSQFTGGAAFATAGSVGGIVAALMGAVAML